MNPHPIEWSDEIFQKALSQILYGPTGRPAPDDGADSEPQGKGSK